MAASCLVVPCPSSCSSCAGLTLAPQDPLSGPCGPGGTTLAQLTAEPQCCLMPICGRLRVLVLTLPPCSALPTTSGVAPGSLLGLSVTGPAAAVVNGPPLTTITAGLPYEVAVAGRPVASVDVSPLPPAVVTALGSAVHTACLTSLLFDFGSAGAYNVGCRSTKCAEGKVVALGKQGAGQASLTFKYRWCSPLTKCGAAADNTLVPFEVVDCSAKGLTFVVVDATSFLSTNPCTESLVILNLQQYCPGPLLVPATPATVPACCLRPLQPSETTAMLACSSCPAPSWGPASS